MQQAKEIAVHVWTAAAGTTGKETVFGGIIAAIGVTLSNFLGGWDQPLQVLLYLMAADYVTGLLGAIKEKRVNSDTMFWGGIRKVTVLFVIGLAALIDQWLQSDSPVFRMIAVYFYIGREGLSVVENLGTLGVPLPGKLREFLEQLQDKGEGANVGKGN